MWQVRQLEAFATVVAEGGITRAAEKLNISQPAVSKLVATLEDKCGFEVFSRRGNQLTLTAEGELLYSEVARLVTSTEEIRAKAEQIREHQFGTLHVAACPALASRLLPTITHEFLQSSPTVKPLLTSRSSQFLVDWMTVQKSDLGISMIAQPRPGLAMQRMMRLHGLCVMPPGHHLTSKRAIKPSDLLDEKFISLCVDDRTGYDVDEFFSGYSHKRSILAEVQMSEAACQMVADGAGVAIVDPLSVMGFSRDVLPARPLDPVVPFDLWLIYPTFRPLSRVAKAYAMHLEKSLAAHLRRQGMEFTAYPLEL